MTKINAVSIVLRERTSHPLVGKLGINSGLDSPISCAQAKLMADVVEDMWEFLPDEKRAEIRERMKEFNNL